MRIIIYGAGAIGSIIGGYLQNTGREAILVCSKAHAKAIAKNGLQVKGIQGSHKIEVPAVDDMSKADIRDDDIVFLTMKTFDTEDAIARLGEKAARLSVVCFQNGVRNEEMAARHFKRVYGGIVFLGAKYLEPGTVIHTAESSLGIGLYPEGLDSSVDMMAEILTPAGFTVTKYPNIMAVKWAKLFRNLNNAFFSITGLSVLEGIKYEESRSFMGDTLEEAMGVVQAEGIEILPLEGQQPPDKMIASFKKPGNREFEVSENEEMAVRPSTWQDLHLKRGRTEVDYFNGEIVRLGRKHDIPTPLNSLMVAVVTGMAADKKPPGAYTVSQLREMLKGPNRG